MKYEQNHKQINLMQTLSENINKISKNCNIVFKIFSIIFTVVSAVLVLFMVLDGTIFEIIWGVVYLASFVVLTIMSFIENEYINISAILFALTNILACIELGYFSGIVFSIIAGGIYLAIGVFDLMHKNEWIHKYSICPVVISILMLLLALFVIIPNIAVTMVGVMYFIPCSLGIIILTTFIVNKESGVTVETGENRNGHATECIRENNATERTCNKNNTDTSLDHIQTLKELKELLDLGILTQEEFQIEKEKILKLI